METRPQATIARRRSDRLIGQYVTHCKVPLHGAIGFVKPQEMLARRQP